MAEGCQAADELPVVDLIVAGLVEHAKQPVQDLRVRLHDAHQLQRLPDRVLHVACTYEVNLNTRLVFTRKQRVNTTVGIILPNGIIYWYLCDGRSIGWFTSTAAYDRYGTFSHRYMSAKTNSRHSRGSSIHKTQSTPSLHGDFYLFYIHYYIDPPSSSDT